MCHHLRPFQGVNRRGLSGPERPSFRVIEVTKTTELGPGQPLPAAQAGAEHSPQESLLKNLSTDFRRSLPSTAQSTPLFQLLGQVQDPLIKDTDLDSNSPAAQAGVENRLSVARHWCRVTRGFFSSTLRSVTFKPRLHLHYLVISS